jgi:hypothetical protein
LHSQQHFGGDPLRTSKMAVVDTNPEGKVPRARRKSAVGY